MFDEDGYLETDPRREALLYLVEERNCMEEFLQKVERITDIPYRSTSEFAQTMQTLDNIRMFREDMAGEACRLINQGKCIQRDVERHAYYIAKKGLGINLDEFFS